MTTNPTTRDLSLHGLYGRSGANQGDILQYATTHLSTKGKLIFEIPMAGLASLVGDSF